VLELEHPCVSSLTHEGRYPEVEQLYASLWFVILINIQSDSIYFS